MRSLIKRWASTRIMKYVRQLEFENIRLKARLARADEDRQILERQRDTLLDTLDRIQWDQRAQTALSMVDTKRLGVAENGDR